MKLFFSARLMFAFVFHLLIFIRAYGQSNIKSLKVGDQCPNFELNNVINYSTDKIKLSDFKGKLVIIDFWATWCAPCVSGMPRLDSLQKKYADKIAILAVTSDTPEKVKKFLTSNNLLKDVSLPLASGDTLLRKYFQYTLLPHEVWIDSDRKVVAITGAEEITSDNITALLQNGGGKLKEKKDVIEGNLELPMLFGGLGEGYKLDKNQLIASSLLTSKIEGLPGSSSGIQLIGEKVKIVNFNVSVAQLYRNAFGAVTGTLLQAFNKPNFQLRSPSRTIIESGNPKLNYSIKNRNPDLYCYEIILPIQDTLEINKKVVEDLNNYFGAIYNIIGTVEKRKVKCWVLTRISKRPIPVSKDEKPGISFGTNDDQLILKNTTIKHFLYALVGYHYANSPNPFLDETNYKDVVDLQINARLNDVAAVSKELEKQGFKFRLVNRYVDMVIIKNK